jgi:putative molybdopterin biosynthesis protein
MKNILHYHSDDVFRILGDSIRVNILRRLISQPATISQLGVLLGRHPAHIKYHIVQLEKVGLVELAYNKTIKNYTEKYYRATANAFFLNRAILPWPSEKGQIVILGGDGPALELLVREVNSLIGSNVFCSIPAGSLDSLIYLRENYCQIAGCHLFDFESGDFNVSYIRHIFAFKNMIMVTIGHRDQGFVFRKDDLEDISSFDDIIKRDLTFVNRELGTETRLRVDNYLSEARILPGSLKGYNLEVQTNSEIGEFVHDKKADVGIGLGSIARQLNLGFHYLFTERYDLVMSEETYQSVFISTMINTLRSEKTHSQIEALGGYDMTHAGEVIKL